MKAPIQRAGNVWRLSAILICVIAAAIAAPKAIHGQALAPSLTTKTGTQPVDQEYTKKILENTPDKRILTELIDHMPLPADPKVLSPLKFFGYVPGENNQLTYHKDIVRYLDALQKASPR